MKCSICNSEIEEIFLGKLKGTIVKINEKGKNEIFYICSECQKRERDIKGRLRKN